MTYTPNANWTAEVAKAIQAPVYYVAIDGLTSTHYSTAPVKSPAVTKVALMQVPQGRKVSLDLLDGRQTVNTFTFELLDVDDQVTDLIATEAPGAAVGSLIHRKVTVYGGYRSLAESDYAEIFVGRIKKISWNNDGTGYRFELVDATYSLDGEIMSNADSENTEPSSVRGNVCNVYWGILTGTFSLSGDFPLDSFSSYSAGVSSAPTGLGIPTAEIDETGIAAQRDDWHADTVVSVTWHDPVNAKQELEDQLFRVFHCQPALTADGKLGLRFHVPSMGGSEAVNEDDIVTVKSWSRDQADHLNKFRYWGDWDEPTDTYTSLYSTDTSDDTANRTATGETVEWKVESTWLESAYVGEATAAFLADMMRRRFLPVPARLSLGVTMRKRAIEQGDVVAVTSGRIPDLLTGNRGVTMKLMTVVAISPDLRNGLLTLDLVDSNYTRYGAINRYVYSVQEYDDATEETKNGYAWICDGSLQLGAANDPAFRLI